MFEKLFILQYTIVIQNFTGNHPRPSFKGLSYIVLCVFYSSSTMKTMICIDHNFHRSSNKALDACAHG